MKSRWDAFTEAERFTIQEALVDSATTRPDPGWYLRCSKLHVELVEFSPDTDGPVPPSKDAA